ncbi:unnamed protein product [Urochloa humidicola]
MKITVHSSKSVMKPAYSGGFRRHRAADGAGQGQLPHVHTLHHPRVPPPAQRPTPCSRPGSRGRWPTTASGRGGLGADADGNRAILLNDAGGVPFVEATSDVSLDTVMEPSPTAEVHSLPTTPAATAPPSSCSSRSRASRAAPSIVVGFTTKHIVANDRRTSNVFLAWSQASRGPRRGPRPGPRSKFPTHYLRRDQIAPTQTHYPSLTGDSAIRRRRRTTPLPATARGRVLPRADADPRRRSPS